MEAVQLIADGKAPRIPQTEEGVTYEGIQKKENAKVLISSQQLISKCSVVPNVPFPGQNVDLQASGPQPSSLLLMERNISMAFDTVNIRSFSLCLVLS